MPTSTSIVPANFNGTVQCPYFLDDNQRSSANIIPACTSVVPANANFTNYYQHTSCLYCSHRGINNECSQLDTNVLFNANSMQQSQIRLRNKYANFVDALFCLNNSFLSSIVSSQLKFNNIFAYI